MSIPNPLTPFLTTKLAHETWAGTFRCKPLAVFQPRTLEEVQTLVNEARAQNKTIMTVGSGHSPSDLTMTTEWLCNLDKLNKVLEKRPFYGPLNEDPSKQEVKFVDLTVDAGCRVYELNLYVKKHNLAVQNLGSISDQLIAGLISTGTHGLTQYHGLVSQQVVSLELVNAAGKIVHCSSIERPDVFRAALLSLGKIGIITRVTLRLCPSYTIKSKQEIISFETLLKNWSNIWLDSEFIRIWWFPYTNSCVCWRASKSNEPLSSPRTSWYGTKFGRFFYELLLWVSVNLFPRLTPAIERFVFKQQYGKVETLSHGDVAVQHSVDGLNMDCLFSQVVNEWLAPLADGVHVLKQLKAEIDRAAKANDYYVHAPIEVRCSNVTNSDSPFINDVTGEKSLYPSEKWLAQRTHLSSGPIPGNNFRPYLDNSPELPFLGEGKPVTNLQLTMFINATMYRPFRSNVETKKWFQAFEDIMSRAGGKPHWAKNFIGLDGTQSTYQDLKVQLDYGGKPFYTMMGFNPVMKSWFGEKLVKYNNIRREMDPQGVFMSGKPWAERNGLLIEN